MTVNSLTKTEATDIAKALSGFGIKKLSGNGVGRELREALGQTNPDVTIGTSDETKAIRDFFNHIDDINKKLESLRSQAVSGKYSRMSRTYDLYDYINLVLQAEKGNPLIDDSLIVGFDAKAASTSDIIKRLDVLKVIHANGKGIITNLRDMDTFAKTRIFKNDDCKEYYNRYLLLKNTGILDNIELLKKLPCNLLSSVQVAERVLTTLQTSMNISRPESVWLYNYLLELKGANEFIDMENEYAVLTCPNCGAAHRQSSKQFAALYGKKQQAPLCPACKEPLLKKCPQCGKWVLANATKHHCGWNEEFSKHKAGLEQALTHNDLTGVRNHLDSLEQMSTQDMEIDDLKSRAHKALEDLNKKLKNIRASIDDGKLADAEAQLKVADKLYTANSDLLEIHKDIIARKRLVRKAELLKNIRNALDNGDLNKARSFLTSAEEEGLSAEDLDTYRREILQRNKIAVSTAYIAELDQLIREGKLALAENKLAEAKKYDIGNELYKYNVLINSKKEDADKLKQQAINEFGDGHFGIYVNGIKKIARILDIYPECQQAKIWLKDNPRSSSVVEPTLSFTPGEKQCTISWKDDDSFSRYTVCRADGRYPRDPADGVVVCREISNCKISDTLPLDRPGIMWQYSVFAVRTLDGQWTKADCPREAAWLPNPSSVSGKANIDRRGFPVIQLTWAKPPQDCLGVQILRKDSSDGFGFSSTPLNASSKDSDHQLAQMQCSYTDDNVDSDTTYRYTIKQVWKKGQTSFMSSGVLIEVKIP